MKSKGKEMVINVSVYCNGKLPRDRALYLISRANQILRERGFKNPGQTILELIGFLGEDQPVICIEIMEPITKDLQEIVQAIQELPETREYKRAIIVRL